MIRLVWALAGLGLILLAASLFAPPLAFLDWRAATIVLGGMACFTFARHPIEAIFRGTLHAEADAASVAAMRTLRSTTHASGGLGFLIGVIGALQSVADPSQIWAPLATALLSPTYALIFGELFIAPVLHRRQAQCQAAPK